MFVIILYGIIVFTAMAPEPETIFTYQPLIEFRKNHFRHSSSVLFNKLLRTLKVSHHSPILRTFVNNILRDETLCLHTI